jgi:glucan phosphoethanolaminetransferase (alkaline phosphatase superfamily)
MSISKRISDNQVVILVVLVLSFLDLALLERKFGLFSGGFLLPERIGTPSARLVFGCTVLALEAGLAGCFWYLFHIIGLIRGAALGLTRYLFLVLYGGGSVLGVIAKYQILSYFGDFISVAMMRNLAGGSLTGALGYGAVEFMKFGAWLVPGIFCCWLCFNWLKKRVPTMRKPVRHAGAMRQLGLRMLACLALLLGAAAASNANATMRRYLPKTTPFALAHSVIEEIVGSDQPYLAQFAQTPAAPRAQASVGFGARKDNLILIVSESTRADVLGADVAGTPVTPAWRQLAAEGAAAASYYSHTGYTIPSLKSLFLGSLDNSRPLGGSLFELLKRNGYQVVVVSGQDESFGGIARDSGETVADIYFDARSAKSERVFSSADAGSLALSNGRVVQQFEAVAQQIDWRRPVFVYMNLQAAHFPYDYPAMPRTIDKHPLARGDISEARKAELKETYLNAVAYSDWATARVIQTLKDHGVYDRSLVTVTGDHGESLFDDGTLGHGMRISDNQLHTLLVANRKLPAFSGLLGQSDLAAELLRGIGATVDGARPHSPVLQIIGAPTMPAELGYVYPDGRRFSVHNANREIHADWLSTPLPADLVKPHGREDAELHKLVQDWKTQIQALGCTAGAQGGCSAAR